MNNEQRLVLQVNGLKGNIKQMKATQYDLKAQLRLLSRKYNLLQGKYNIAVKDRKDSFKGQNVHLKRQLQKGEIEDYQYTDKIKY